ncbi:MAG: NADP-dependent oxidoreductase [Candidatus Hydrogenedentes bacterium]|nr:NADP-dependent oxidoreductase [Candidatus Hydrogenedentota bacterium]
MPEVNRVYTLAARPVGFPKETDFKLTEQPKPAPGDGEFLIRTRFVSVDPYMRGRMNEARGYADPFEIGKTIYGGAVGEIVESNNDNFKVGGFVHGMWGWQDYAVSDGKGVFPVDPGLAPVQTSIGVLGMPGMTAYFGFLEICKPKPGDCAFISGAAGAVGQLVGQIAKIKGCSPVVGSCGSDEKVEYLTKDCGYDAAFNYKTDTNYLAKVRELCPKGVDCYFDNVGGDLTDAVFANLAPMSRVSICGMISQYNLEKPETGPRTTYMMMLIRQVTVQGFLVPQFGARFPEGIQQMAGWIEEGKITYREDIVEGLENTPKAFIQMLNGKNKGKQLVKVS